MLYLLLALAFAADEARFALSEINWGILPGGGATKVVVDLLSMRDAMYHALTGELIDAQTALSWGLVNRVVPLVELDDAVRAEALLKPVGHAEDTAVDADVFAEDDDPLVSRHLLRERLVDRADHVELWHTSPCEIVNGE